MTRICAIHQPNFLPRLSTLAKLLSADIWVVLDDVQFVRRDYQHRTKLAELDEPSNQRWLSLSTHLPDGRSTLVRHARLVDAEHCARRAEGLLMQYFGRSPHWAEMRTSLDALVEQIAKSEYLHEVTTMSTQVLLDLCGWQGAVVRSSDLQVRTGRSERLADLTALPTPPSASAPRFKRLLVSGSDSCSAASFSAATIRSASLFGVGQE